MALNRVTLIVIGTLIATLSVRVSACDKKNYTIGVQSIDYTPHYNFTTSDRLNFLNEFIIWLELKTQCKFTILSLPIKRLNFTFEEQQTIDFIYPDNPNWHDISPSEETGIQRVYSPSIAVALGGTMVTEANKYISIAQFNTLAIPRGFTPVAWLPLKAQKKVNFREVSDAKASLLMVQTGRVDGADIEYNVAQYLIKKHKLLPMVLADNLPFIYTDFHLSTFTQLDMMKTITELVNNHQIEIKEMKKKVRLLEQKPNKN